MVSLIYLFLTMRRITLFFGITFVAIGLFVGSSALRAATDCGIYSSSVPAGYAPPISFFEAGDLLVRTFCTGTTGPVTLQAGRLGATNIAVYKKAWHYNGSQWVETTLSGNPLEGSPDWIVGLGQGTVVSPQSGRNYVVAHVCTNIEGVWKCGCSDEQCQIPKWQLQAFDVNSGSQANCSGGDGLVILGTSKDRWEDWPTACAGKPYRVNITGCPGGLGVRFNNFRFGADAPPGLSVDKRLVTGTPTVPGTYEFFVYSKNGTFTCAGGVRIQVLP